MMTREQFENELNDLVHDARYSGDKDSILKAHSLLLAHDAALRTELAACQAERERWYGAAQERMITMNRQEVTIANLQAQLAQVEQERQKEHERANNFFDLAVSKDELITEITAERDAAREHLATAQAKIKELEDYIKYGGPRI